MALPTSSKFHFKFWILFFFSALCMVPLLISLEQFVLAKVLGIIVVVTISVMVRVWLKKVAMVKQRPDSIRIGINEQFWLKEHSEFYRSASVSDRKVIETRLGLMLTKISFQVEGASIPSKELCLSIGLSAVRYFFNRPFWDLGLFSMVHVVPNQQHKHTLKESVIYLDESLVASNDLDAIWKEIEQVSMEDWKAGKLSQDVYATDFFAKS